MQLIELEDLFDGIKNYSIAVKEKGNDVVFLRRIVPGGTDRSYGIHVAKLAGLPKKVLDRADELLEEYAAEAPLSHKGTHHVEISKEAATDETQGSLFDDTIRDTLMGLDVMTMTPLEAMNTLYQLAEEAKREGGKLS